MLNFYKRMLRLRKQTPALIVGDYTPLHETAEGYFACLRRQTCLVVIKLSDKTYNLKFDLNARAARCLFSTHIVEGETISLEELKITPFEIFVGEIIS